MTVPRKLIEFKLGDSKGIFHFARKAITGLVIMYYDFHDNGSWVFSNKRKFLYTIELQYWRYEYLPIPMKGLTVLDVGAGEGESARFFFENGAKKVICIESDKEAFKILEKNAKNRNMVCINKYFSPYDLKIPHDFMKMDIEGYEEQLLYINYDKPCAIEIHGLQLRDKFREKGYMVIEPIDEIGSVSLAYR